MITDEPHVLQATVAEAGQFIAQTFRDVDVGHCKTNFNGILKETADSIGVSNFIPPIDEFQDDDFADRDHFSAKGAAKFALMITPIVKSSCK